MHVFILHLLVKIWVDGFAFCKIVTIFAPSQETSFNL